VDGLDIDAAERMALAPFERGGTGEGPYHVQQDLQASMQDLVSIVRTESEMQQALQVLATLRDRAARVGVTGHREYHNGWHTALDLDNLLIVSEAIARSALERKESRGGHFRDDFPKQDPAFGKVNVVTRCTADGTMSVSQAPLAEIPPELKQVIEENK
jgi:succinate dehydrogenase / fumarate reductase flavoprotein subunit